MRVVITANGAGPESAVDPLFGRCAIYIFADTDTGTIEALPNPAAGAASGAGVMAAQFVIEQNVQAILTGNVGPNAMDVFQANDIPVYMLPADVQTVGQALDAFRTGKMAPLAGATVGAHRTPVAKNPVRDQKIAALGAKARELRQELASILDEIEQLEKEN